MALLGDLETGGVDDAQRCQSGQEQGTKEGQALVPAPGLSLLTCTMEGLGCVSRALHWDCRDLGCPATDRH